ncbi:MAG: transposase [Patescibacteria group bacterium]|nr:transposase [Patescibacteria group bacterium]
MNEKIEQPEKYEGAYHHIYNRGSDKRAIFMDEKDCERFLECLNFYNSPNQIDLFKIKREDPISPKEGEIGSSLNSAFVEIFCYCLMPNHFHLILKELVDGGIARFMHKVGIGYTMYFNKKYDRSGHLFEGKYKHKEIDADFYLTYLTGYIHLNPVMAGLAKLPEHYKYSSYLDYLGKKKTDFLNFKPEELETKIEDYEKFILDLKNDKEALKKIEKVSLE